MDVGHQGGTLMVPTQQKSLPFPNSFNPYEAADGRHFWLLHTIRYLNRAPSIFQKDYVAPKPIVNRPVFNYKFDNHDNFFDDLPSLSLQMQRGRKLTLPKEAQLR